MKLHPVFRALLTVAIGFVLVCAAAAAIFGAGRDTPFLVGTWAMLVGTWPYALGVALLVVFFVGVLGRSTPGAVKPSRNSGDYSPGDSGRTGISMSGEPMRHHQDSHGRHM